MAARFRAYVIRLVALAMMGHMVLSWWLWLPSGGQQRTYPTVPAVDISVLDNVVFQWTAPGLLLLVLLLMLITPEKKWIPWAFLATCAAMIVADLTRLQVWVWCYILLIFNFLSPQKQPGHTVAAVLWTLTPIYFWGGLNKLNPYFQEDIFPWWCEAHAALHALSKHKNIALAVAWAEALLAVGLLFRPTRRLFIVFVVCFHLINLLTFSKLGLNWNAVIMPWNAMLALTWLLFWKLPDFDLLSVFHKKHFPSNAGTLVAVVLAWWMPLLNFAGWFPENLSWKMYSGTHPEATVFWDKSLKISVPDAVQVHIFGEKEHRLTLDDWAMTELGVVPFATQFYFRAMFRRLTPRFQGHGDGDAGMFILTADFFDKKKVQVEEWHFSTPSN